LSQPSAVASCRSGREERTRPYCSTHSACQSARSIGQGKAGGQLTRACVAAISQPASRAIVKEVVWTPAAQPQVDELEWFRFTIGRIGDLNGIPVMVSRTGYTGELGFEIFCHPKDAVPVWDAVWEAGQPQPVAAGSGRA